MTKISTYTSRKKTSVVPLTPTDVKHSVRGADIRAALDAAGATQSGLSKACKYKSGARVSHIVNSDIIEISGGALSVLVSGLRAIGADVTGYVTLE